MKKIRLGLFGTAALALGVVSCASSGWDPVAVTRDSSVVASCTKIDDLKVQDVKADEKLSTVEAERMLVEKARSKGANYVLIASEDGRQGSAYRCTMAPAAATTSGTR